MCCDNIFRRQFLFIYSSLHFNIPFTAVNQSWSLSTSIKRMMLWALAGGQGDRREKTDTIKDKIKALHSTVCYYRFEYNTIYLKWLTLVFVLCFIKKKKYWDQNISHTKYHIIPFTVSRGQSASLVRATSDLSFIVSAVHVHPRTPPHPLWQNT